jgi:hypothetical protein
MSTLPPLSGDDIANILSKSSANGQLPREFAGTFLEHAIDRVTLPLMKDRGYFLLLEPEHVETATIGHWCLLYFRRGQPMYFDPFGVGPTERTLAFIRRNKRRVEGKTGVMSDFDCEDVSSESCGWWCLHVFRQLVRGQTLEQVLSEGWTDDTKENERRLAQWAAASFVARS